MGFGIPDMSKFDTIIKGFDQKLGNIETLIQQLVEIQSSSGCGCEGNAAGDVTCKPSPAASKRRTA